MTSGLVTAARMLGSLALWIALDVTAAGPTDPMCTGTCQMTYGGGSVISNVKLYAVMWTAAVNAETQSQIGDFLQAVSNNDYLDWLNEYNTTFSGGTQQAIGRGVFGGSFTITPSVASQNLNDSDISLELDAQINAGRLPSPDANSLYMLYFPAGYSIHQQNMSSCVAGGFCAYHNSYLRSGKVVYYGVMADLSTGSCATGCGAGSQFQKLCAVSSHEMMEAITDAPGYLGPTAWYDQVNFEVGDMCRAHDDTIDSIFTGVPYQVQQIFSNQSGKCVTTRTDATDFKIWFNPNTVSLVAGSAATAQLPLFTSTTAGASQTLSLSVSGLPTGVTGSLSSNALTSGANATLTLSAAAAVTAATDAVVVTTATSGSTHTAAVLVQVKVPTNDFTISAPGSIYLARGASNRSTVSTASIKGSAENINFTMGSLPTGISAKPLVPSQVIAGAATTLTLDASAGAARGVSTVAIIGTSPSTEKIATFALHVIASPTASFTTPTDGAALTGPQTIAVTGTADPETAVAEVMVLDGSTQLGSCTSVPCTFTWNTQQANNGPHTLQVIAADGTGAQGTASIKVTLQNAGAPGPGGAASVVATVGCASTWSGGFDRVALTGCLTFMAACQGLRTRRRRVARSSAS